MANVHLFWRQIRRLLFWAALAFSYGAAIWPGDGAPSLGGSDKTDHIVAFIVLTLLAALAYPSRSRWLSGAWLSLYGVIIELSQATPIVGRDANVADWVADSAAIIVGSLAGLALKRYFPSLFDPGP